MGVLSEKFLQSDSLRAEVFRSNLKYLHVKNSFYGKQNHDIASLRELKEEKKNWRKDPQIFKFKRFKNSKKIQKAKMQKSASTWRNVLTSCAKSKDFETNLLAYEAKQLDDISQVVVAIFQNCTNFELAFVVFMPNITANQAIT